MGNQDCLFCRIVAGEIPADIIYEDDSLLIVNKPAGLVVHPAVGNWQGTLVNALAYHFEHLPNMKGNIGRPGLVQYRYQPPGTQPHGSLRRTARDSLSDGCR